MQGLISVLFTNPVLFLILFVSLCLSVAVHEFAHALIAYKLGDTTSKDLGRLTLNPMAHLDVLGTLALLIAGFGWGKPVPVNYYNLKNPKKDAALISIAGPGSNFILAIIAALLIKISAVLLYNTTLPIFVSAVLTPLILYNLMLGIFNLLPIEPLDGFKIVNGILPPSLSVQWVQLAPYGIYILLFAIVTGITSRIILPTVVFIAKLLTNM